MLKLKLLFITVISITFYSFATQDSTVTDTTKKINIAVMDLEPRGGLSASEILSISDRFRGELINTGKYNVLERGQMDEILKEQGFQQTGVCSEASCIVEVGQLLAVHKMVGGSIGKVGKVFSINLKVVDVESGKIERQVADDIKCTKEELVSFHIKNVARKMAGLVKEKKPLLTRAIFWVPVSTVIAGGGAVLSYMLLNNTSVIPSGNQTENMRGINVEIPLQ